MPFAHSRSETVVASREYLHSRGALVRELSTGHSTVSTRTSGGSIYIVTLTCGITLVPPGDARDLLEILE